MPEEFRRDLLDAMKQGAPERYKGEVQRYYRGAGQVIARSRSRLAAVAPLAGLRGRAALPLVRA